MMRARSVRRSLRGLISLSLLLGLTLPGCTANPQGESPATVGILSLNVPEQVLNLTGRQEDLGSVLEGQSKVFYVDQVGLLSLREDELLRATLQVTKFRDSAPFRTARFRSSVVSLLSGTAPQKLKVGEETLFMTSGNQQLIFAWFRDQRFFVLTVHRDFEMPRTLVREVLRLEL